MVISTVGDSLYWCYANLAMAHAASEARASTYRQLHYIIRNRTYHGLRDGRMSVAALAEDERLKLVLPQACCYCGSRESLAVDHLIPRKRGGPHAGENMVWACRRCNSSKGAKDVLVWLNARNTFPALLLLRRYLKLAIEHCRDRELLNRAVTDDLDTPFTLAAIPHKFPPPRDLTMWVIPLGGDDSGVAVSRAPIA